MPAKANKTPWEWLQDAEEFYIAARCLILNGILNPGFLYASRSLEKYLKTILISNGRSMPMAGKKGHNLMLLYKKIVSSGLLHQKFEIKKILKFFNEITDNVAYVEGGNRKQPPFHYGMDDIDKIDKVVFEFENALSGKVKKPGMKLAVGLNKNEAVISHPTLLELINSLIIFGKPGKRGKYMWLFYANKYFKQRT